MKKTIPNSNIVCMYVCVCVWEREREREWKARRDTNTHALARSFLTTTTTTTTKSFNIIYIIRTRNATHQQHNTTQQYSKYCTVLSYIFFLKISMWGQEYSGVYKIFIVGWYIEVFSFFLFVLYLLNELKIVWVASEQRMYCFCFSYYHTRTSEHGRDETVCAVFDLHYIVLLVHTILCIQSY